MSEGAAGFCGAFRDVLWQFVTGLTSAIVSEQAASLLNRLVYGLVLTGKPYLSEALRALEPVTPEQLMVPLMVPENRASRLLRSQPRRRGARGYPDDLVDAYRADIRNRLPQRVTVVVNTADLSKPRAQRLEGLGKVKDHSDPAGPVRPGYMLAMAVAVVDGALMPLDLELLSVSVGRGDSENRELVDFVCRADRWLKEGGKEPLFLLDRDFDRREVLGPLLAAGVAFVVRLVGNRLVELAGGGVALVERLARQRKREGRGIWSESVRLPGVEEHELLLVVASTPKWRPLYLLVSPAARGRGRTADWWVKVYRMRWEAENTYRSWKQLFSLEKFLVRSLVAIRRLLWLCAIALYWLSRYAGRNADRLWQFLRQHGYLGSRPKHLFCALCGHVLRRPQPVVASLPAGP